MLTIADGGIVIVETPSWISHTMGAGAIAPALTVVFVRLGPFTAFGAGAPRT